MAEASKILTVSYGTFSCTLEGFDDAFDTMKAIAEYFRDLAADDRYFGAEPPTPDPEMLARIAEREVERRVEARLERGAYVLRPAALTAAGTSDLAPWPVAAAPRAAEPAEARARSPEPADAAAESDAPDATAGPAADTQTAPSTAPTDVAAQAADAEDERGEVIARALRSVETAEPDTAGPEAAPAATMATPAAPEGGDSAGVQGETEVHPEADAEDKHAPLDAVAPKEAAPPNAADASERDAPPSTARTADEADPGQAVDLIDTKPWEDLTYDERREFRRRRRAERGMVPADGTQDAGSGAEPTEDGADKPAAGGPDGGHDAATRGADDGMSDPSAAPARETAEDDVTARLARLHAAAAADIAGAGDAALAVDEGRDPAADPSDDTELEALRSLIRQNELAVRDDAPVSEDRTATPATTDGVSPAMAPAPREPGAEATAPIRARVVKMRRSDFEARFGQGAAVAAAEHGAARADSAPAHPAAVERIATAQDNAAPRDGTQAQDDGTARSDNRSGSSALADLARLDGLEEYDGQFSGQTVSAGGLSPAAEADLMQELAEVERMSVAESDDIAPGAGPAAPARIEDLEARGPATAPVAPPRDMRATFLDTPPEADEAGMSRILTETDAHLNEPEASRRREAIAHLKAAVAATEAARQLGEDGRDADEDGENMFRDDLDQVVRPRRTTRPLTRSERPRPAPLKLVASQRVDAPETTARADGRLVLPRRVEAGAVLPDAAEAAVQERFARFASDMGTAGLTDMIEAAAAHAIFNEGGQDVSRPQLMRMVQGIVPGDFSREDGLRAFGTLLRQGRLEKVSNGRFRVSPQTRYNPRRAASGS
jgi:hypothetical protein